MKIVQRLLFVLLLSGYLGLSAYADEVSPLGYWQTVDDKTGKILSVVEIYQGADGKYNGRVYKIEDVVVDGKRQNPKDVCTTCGGAKANKPFLCMDVVWGMSADPDKPKTWTGGTAYDPKSDNTYHAMMWFDDNNNVLNLRGYIGVPVFGRTVHWLRTSKPAPSDWVCSLLPAKSW